MASPSVDLAWTSGASPIWWEALWDGISDPSGAWLAMLLPVALAAAIVTTAQPALAATAPWGTVLVPGSALARLVRLALWATSTSTATGTVTRTSGGRTAGSTSASRPAARWGRTLPMGTPRSDGTLPTPIRCTPPARTRTPPSCSSPTAAPISPQFGDLLVFDQTSFDPSGHVAVVTSVGDGYVNIVEQNWGSPTPPATPRSRSGRRERGLGSDLHATALGGCRYSAGWSSTVLRQGVAGSGGALPSASPAPSGAEPPTQINPPTRPPWGRRCPPRCLRATRRSALSAPGSTSSGPDPAVPLPPCDCTWGTQFLPTGAGGLGGRAADPTRWDPPRHRRRGRRRPPGDIPPGISTMPPTNAPQPRIE